MSHHVDLDDSFKDNLPKLKDEVRRQVGAIVHSLQANEFLEPGDDYLFERSPKDQSCGCAHSSGSWGDWKLVWYYEYSSVLPSAVEAVVVLLVQEGFELTPIKPRSA
jgi:hypothetical protein